MADPRVEIHPDALAEAHAAREWYGSKSELLGDAFVEELDRAISEIFSAPDRWPRYAAGTRRFLLRRFPFVVVYRRVGPTIQVIAVAHGRRRPGYWKAR